MTTRREFAAAAGGAGIGAALAAAAGLARSAGPTAPPSAEGIRAAEAAGAAGTGGTAGDPGRAGSRASAASAADTLRWADVTAHGAEGDGRTDDTDALQRLFDARSAGVVYFPPGAYVIRRTIRVRSPVSILGDGGRSSYLLSRIDDGGPVLDIGDPGHDDRIRGVRIAGLTIRGEGEGRTRSGGLRLNAFYDSVVDSVRIETLGWGLDCNRAIAVQFDNLVVTGMSDGGGQPGEGVYLYGQSNGCLFNNLRSADHAGAGLRLGDGQGLTLVAPVMESVRSAAIVVGQERGGRFVNCRGVTILNPYFEKNRPHDMHFLRGTPPTLMGGYWGPLHDDYVAPILSTIPLTAIGCAFPAAPGGALRVERPRASALFLGCSFDGEVATFTRPDLRGSARLRVLGPEGE